MITFFVWEYQTFLPLWPVGILGKVCSRVSAKPISDPRESVLVSGLHFLCPYLEVNRLGHP
jgi:hypothetical protein